METKNEALWRLAQLRAKFKNSVVTYLIINTALIVFWYLGSGPNTFFWPAFPLFFWGLGLMGEYYRAYLDKGDLAEKEYQKLVQNQ
ncbi:2TM domain-containing protein [Arundinibacter roseus]|uniref:2TM domain-containing protein n=1 Tax=Arundinibacter roseus TaxID=2070510 RepID=A0A4R4KIG3_9BACT|nr:2TM domain-containing protein [Arundinibacter roseus]TDB67980.1 2TM domain-containing protein [Arundinibacter roseus]